jgi:hypothetical protein
MLVCGHLMFAADPQRRCNAVAYSHRSLHTSQSGWRGTQSPPAEVADPNRAPGAPAAASRRPRHTQLSLRAPPPSLRPGAATPPSLAGLRRVDKKATIKENEIS